MQFIKLIQKYSIEKTKIIIFNDDDNHTTNKLISIIKNSLNIIDVKTTQLLYPHLIDIKINKIIHNYYDNKTTIDKNKYICENENENIIIKNIIDDSQLLDFYDLMIINTNNLTHINKILINMLSKISTCVIINNEVANDKIHYLDATNNKWCKNIHSDANTHVYEYIDPLWLNVNVNNHNVLHNYYELMHYVHHIFFNNDVSYFLIKSSCLGCVRNRAHIVFCDKIHMFVSNEKKNIVMSLINEFKKVNVEHDTLNNVEDMLILYFSSLKKVKVIIYFYDEQDEQYVSNSIKIDKAYVGDTKQYYYGALRVSSLEYPNEYLINTYGDDVFTHLKHDNNIIIKNPKFVYDCYYNQWSSYTSPYWKKKQIAHLNDIYTILINNGIYCWIDCGTLLGATRDNDIPLFDDDTDIGLFEQDHKKVMKLLKNVELTPMIKYVNDTINFKDYYNLKKTHNGKENISYTYSINVDLCCEFRCYTIKNNHYISVKDWYVSETHKVYGLMEKRQVDVKYFNANCIEKIRLGEYFFYCPNNHREYLELDARYGANSIDGLPIRDCKPGNVILYDDFN